MSRNGERRERKNNSDSEPSKKASSLEKELERIHSTRPSLEPELEKTKYVKQKVPETETASQKKVRIETDRLLRRKHNREWKQQNDAIKARNKVVQTSFDNDIADKVNKAQRAAYEKSKAWNDMSPEQQEKARVKSRKKGARTRARNKRITDRQKRVAAKKKERANKKKPKLSKQTYRAGGVDTKSQADYDAEVKKQRKLPKAERQYVNHPDAKANSANNKRIREAANRGPVRKTVDAVKKVPKIPSATMKAIKPVAKVLGAAIPGIDWALASLSPRVQNIPENPTREDFATIRDRDGMGAALWSTMADYGEEVFDPRSNDSYNPLNWQLFSDQAIHAAQDFGLGAANTAKDIYGMVTGDNTIGRLEDTIKRSIPEGFRKDLGIGDPTNSSGDDRGYMEDPENQVDIQKMADEMIGEEALSDRAVELLGMPKAEREAFAIKERKDQEVKAYNNASPKDQKKFETLLHQGDDLKSQRFMTKMRREYEADQKILQYSRNKNADFSPYTQGYERRGDISPIAGPEIISDTESMQKMQEKELFNIRERNISGMPDELYGSRPGSQASIELNGPDNGYEITRNPENIAAAYYMDKNSATEDTGVPLGSMIGKSINAPMALNGAKAYGQETPTFRGSAGNVSPMQYGGGKFGENLPMQPLPGERLNAAFDATNPQEGPRVNPLRDAFYGMSEDIAQRRMEAEQAQAVNPAIPVVPPRTAPGSAVPQTASEIYAAGMDSLNNYTAEGIPVIPAPSSKTAPGKPSKPSKTVPATTAREEAAIAKAEALVASQQAQDAVIRGRERARSAYYDNPLNPLGSGSGYGDLYRAPNQAFLNRQRG